jgi:hypothetical protein
LFIWGGPDYFNIRGFAAGHIQHTGMMLDLIFRDYTLELIPNILGAMQICQMIELV